MAQLRRDAALVQSVLDGPDPEHAVYLLRQVVRDLARALASLAH